MQEAIEKKIIELLNTKEKVIISIDGRCGSGKTTLAGKIKEVFPEAYIIHMDDFYLTSELLTKERLNEVGGNVHYERFKEEVLNHLNDDITYRVFSDLSMSYIGEKKIPKSAKLIIIEGSYSFHPYYGNYSDYKIFYTIDPKEQLARIEKREKENLEDFRTKWIPKEENYFAGFDIEKKADIIIKT